MDPKSISIKSINAAMRSIATFQKAVDVCSIPQAVSGLKVLKDRLDEFIPDDDTPQTKSRANSKKQGVFFQGPQFRNLNTQIPHL